MIASITKYYNKGAKYIQYYQQCHWLMGALNSLPLYVCSSSISARSKAFQNRKGYIAWMGLPIPLQSFSLFLGNSCSGRRSFCSSISCWCSVFRPMTFTNVLLMFFSIGCRILTLVRRWFMIQHDTSTKLTTHISQNFLYTNDL